MLRTQISLSENDRRLLDAEVARTGRSLSALIRDAVARTYSTATDEAADLQAIDDSLGAWVDRGFDGESYTEVLRSGGRLGRARVR